MLTLWSAVQAVDAEASTTCTPSLLKVKEEAEKLENEVGTGVKSKENEGIQTFY